MNWGQQAHTPSIHKSGILYTTKYKDIGEGVLEVTQIIRNFGTEALNHLNTPWGGVRSSNLRGQYLSDTNGNISISNKYTGTEAGLIDIDETGGYFVFAQDTIGSNPASLGIVFGNEVKIDEFNDHNLSRIYLRYAQVGGDTNPRDYSLFVVIPKIYVYPGETFYYRTYYVNGTKQFVSQKSQELVPFTSYGFIEPTVEESPVVSIKGANIPNEKHSYWRTIYFPRPICPSHF